MEEREAYLTIPVEKRLEIANGNQEFTPVELGVSLSKAQIIELAKAEEFILTISENGFGKRTDIEEYRLQSRAGKGIKTYNILEKTGKIVGAEITPGAGHLHVIFPGGQVVTHVFQEKTGFEVAPFLGFVTDQFVFDR